MGVESQADKKDPTQAGPSCKIKRADLYAARRYARNVSEWNIYFKSSMSLCVGDCGLKKLKI